MLTSREMLYHIGLVLRFYPSGYQKYLVTINDGAERAVYNKLVAVNNEIYHLKQTGIYIDTIADRIEYLESVRSSAMGIKNALPFLGDKSIDSAVVDNGIRNYKAAWNNYRKNPSCGVPAFVRKSYFQSYQTNNHYTKDSIGVNDGSSYFCKKNKYFVVPKLGKVRISGSAKMIERILNHKGNTRITTITVSKDATDRYYLSLAIASDTPFVKPMPKTGGIVGLDMNLTNLYADSNGDIIPNLKFRRNFADKYRKEERHLSLVAHGLKCSGRKLVTCKNYQKLRKSVADLQRYMAARTEDYLHVCSKRLIENQDYIFTEDLKVKNLLRNHKLAFAISDVSWNKFFQMLEYKSVMYGKTYIKVPPHYTTQTCSNCGFVCKGDSHIKLGIEHWICPSCRAYLIRDVNAAVNILNRGLAIAGL